VFRRGAQSLIGQHRQRSGIDFAVRRRLQHRPLQNAGTTTGPILYYVFDGMVLVGQSVMTELLETRRDLLERKVLPTLRAAHSLRSMGAPGIAALKAREHGPDTAGALARHMLWLELAPA